MVKKPCRWRGNDSPLPSAPASPFRPALLTSEAPSTTVDPCVHHATRSWVPGSLGRRDKSPSFSRNELGCHLTQESSPDPTAPAGRAPNLHGPCSDAAILTRGRSSLLAFLLLTRLGAPQGVGFTLSPGQGPLRGGLRVCLFFVAAPSAVLPLDNNGACYRTGNADRQ